MAEEDLLDALNISLARPLEEVLTTLRKVPGLLFRVVAEPSI